MLLALLVRLPGVARPLLGNFATRNVVQAMAARNWARGEAPWWRPTLDMLADGEPAWHLVEVPSSAYLSAALWNVFGGSLDAWGRVTAIGWSLLSVALVYGIVRRRSGEIAANAAAFAIAISPISIIYGQSFLLEPSVIALALAAWWGTERFIQHDHTEHTRRCGTVSRPCHVVDLPPAETFGRAGGTVGRPCHNFAWGSLNATPSTWLILVAAALAVLWLSKVYMFVIALPLVILVWNASPRSRALLSYLAMLGLAALPTLWWCKEVWRLAQPRAPTAGRVYYSLVSSAGDHGFPHALLFDSSFYFQFVSDLGTVVLTPVGAIVLAFGASRVAWRTWWPLGVAMLLLVVAMPRKFHEMNYYHLLLLSAWAGVIGLGWQCIVERYRPSRWLTGAAIGIALLLAARYGVRPAFVTPDEDRSVIQAAQALGTLAAPHDTVIASHGTTFDLLYYCDRRGWAMPISDDDVAERIEQHRRAGAKWLVIAGQRPFVVPAAAEAALERNRVAAIGVGFRIYRLDGAGAVDTREGSAASTAMPTAPGVR